MLLEGDIRVLGRSSGGREKVENVGVKGEEGRAVVVARERVVERDRGADFVVSLLGKVGSSTAGGEEEALVDTESTVALLEVLREGEGVRVGCAEEGLVESKEVESEVEVDAAVRFEDVDDREFFAELASKSASASSAVTSTRRGGSSASPCRARSSLRGASPALSASMCKISSKDASSCSSSVSDSGSG